MNAAEEIEVNATEHLKFYSQGAIAMATFFGGPLAAGILIRENYKKFNDAKNGNRALIIGIISTILLFGFIFLIPESIIEKIPSPVIPAVYTAVIYYIVEHIHGKALKHHEQKKNKFQPFWKSIGIGILSMAFLLAGIIGVAMVLPAESFEEEAWINPEYESEMERFGKNETEAVAIYQEIGSKSRFWLYEEIDATAIPRWQENIQITERIAKIEGLPAAYAEMNTSFGKYASYRLEEAILLSKSYKEDTDKYNAELEEINRKIIDNLGVQNFY